MTTTIARGAATRAARRGRGARRGWAARAARAVEVVAANTHSCARLESGLVRCWGPGNIGPLGYGNTDNVGDNKTPSSIDTVRLF